MKEFFEALNNVPIAKPKKHFVTVEGKKLEVDLVKKLEIIRNGEQNYMVKPKGNDFELILKPKINKRGYKLLKKTDQGYVFHDHDPYFPIDYATGGWQWLAEQE